jgi:hypothetical protein
MPCGPGQDALPATPAAAEPQAGLGHVQALRQGVYVDVGLVGAGLACGDDRADAVLAHVGQGHWRAGFAAHGVRRLMEDEVQGDQEGGLHGEDGGAGDNGVVPRHDR